MVDCPENFHHGQQMQGSSIIKGPFIVQQLTSLSLFQLASVLKNRENIMNVTKHVLIVGSGITGSVAASLLSCDKNYKLSIWDKAKGAGGRMSTSRSQINEECTVDLGAQYISAIKEDYQKHKRFYDELLKNGILSPLNEMIEGDRFSEGTQHFVTPKGVSSIVKHFLNSSGAHIQYNQRIVNVTAENYQWKVTCESGITEMFDAMILTMPVPQILDLKGSISTVIDSRPSVKKKLENVEYSSRYAMGLFYNPGTKLDIPWGGKYYEGESCVRFIAIDTKKRGINDAAVGTSVAVHTSVPFTLQHMNENVQKVCTDVIMPNVLKLLPNLPTPAEIKNHRWRYSQVHKPFEGCPGAIILNTTPLLIVGGDAFTKSGFDGCVDSALKVYELFKSTL